MLTDDNKALVQRFYEEVINQKNLAALDQFVAPNAVNHTVPAGLPRGRANFSVYTSMPSLTCKLPWRTFSLTGTRWWPVSATVAPSKVHSGPSLPQASRSQ